MPVAVNCASVPTGAEGFAGVTAIESRTGAVTVSAAVPDTPLTVAVMVTAVGLAVTAVASPAAIVATAVFDDDQVAVAVRFWVVLSL